eukprot:CAMPEP_0113710558 /NCGR_PEP_ID=MMETSP0038_2-20120614/30228_1 /TAXON_ID=2898 /ORGANISM="Cryptomonas paramecium" /LENGTH=122 /DNA_ID=CAMNT_0000636637 /DNA_START=162 /DNA_END=527 /DNA_ORIENTATION=+ /assembly_acc=CAM_ASM_000170
MKKLSNFLLVTAAFCLFGLSLAADLNRCNVGMGSLAQTPGAVPIAADRNGLSKLPRLVRNPCLFQINARVVLRELEARLGKKATLDDIPDADIDSFAAAGFDIVYLLGIWKTGEFGLNNARA